MGFGPADKCSCNLSRQVLGKFVYVLSSENAPLTERMGIWKQGGEEGREPALWQRRSHYKGNQWNRWVRKSPSRDCKTHVEKQACALLSPTLLQPAQSGEGSPSQPWGQSPSDLWPWDKGSQGKALWNADVLLEQLKPIHLFESAQYPENGPWNKTGTGWAPALHIRLSTKPGANGYEPHFSD